MKTHTFFVGGYGCLGEISIYKCSLSYYASEQNYTFQELGSSNKIDKPSYLSFNNQKNMLYAVEELNPVGNICALKIDGNRIEPINSLGTMGADPCHIELDERHSLLFVSNYSGGSFSVFKLNDNGELGSLIFTKEHQGKGFDPVRQEKAHVHFSKLIGDKLFVVDLGVDKLFIYRLNFQDNIEIIEEKLIEFPPGTGPRHLAVNCNNTKYVYVLGELDSSVYLLTEQGGNFKIEQTLSTLPIGYNGENISAAIKVSQDGRYVLCSNRGHDSIAVFKIKQNGQLKKTGVFPTGGKTPRDFHIFDNVIVVANQDSNNLTVLTLKNDELELSDVTFDVTKPTCVFGI